MAADVRAESSGPRGNSTGGNAASNGSAIDRGPQPSHPYDALTPEVILSAVETLGGRCTGALLALNSYENRVYRVEREDAEPVAVKFYRPARWTDAAIAEEHAFTLALAAAEIPAVAPLVHAGISLHRFGGFRFAVFPWQPGRRSELALADERALVGRYLARVHRIGREVAFAARARVGVESAVESVAFVQAGNFVPDYIAPAYAAVSAALIDGIGAGLAATPYQPVSLHGDCHLSNLLWRDSRAFLLDFDDCCTGPAVQDIWMLLSGEREDMQLQLQDILGGYNEFADFDPAELALIEPLRALRLLNYSAWLARRWDDPAFPHNFPWFNTPRYWEEHILTLREQLARLSEPPLVWYGDDAVGNR